MYWTDWGANNTGIFRSRMDGTSVSPIVQTDIRWPNGISLDHTSNPRRLYWVDAWHDQVESSDVNGLLRSVILDNEDQTLHHAFEVLVHSHYLYWTEWYDRTLVRRDISSLTAGDGVKVKRAGQEEEEEGLPEAETLIVADDRPFGFTVVSKEEPRMGGGWGQGGAWMGWARLALGIVQRGLE